jgi:hypothetical protein
MKSVQTLHKGSEALGSVDWAGLTRKPKEEAEEAINAILGQWEGVEDRIYTARMRLFREIRERKLEPWLRRTDPDVGEPFQSCDRWLKSAFPRQWGYCHDAMRTEEPLSDVPMEVIAEISVANLKVLADKGLSSNLRKNKSVLKAAKEKTKEGFIEFLNTKHDQHIEPTKMMPKVGVDKFEEAVAMVEAVEECDRAAALEKIAELIIGEYAVAYEHRKEQAS